MTLACLGFKGKVIGQGLGLSIDSNIMFLLSRHYLHASMAEASSSDRVQYTWAQ